MTQEQKAERFYQLHHQSKPFVMPNPWDIGSARIMEAKGFAALGTTSLGVDHSLGLKNASAGRDVVMANAKMIAMSTTLPVSIDLEDGYAADAEGIEDTIHLAVDAGAVGGSIEDAIYAKPGECYDLPTAVARVKAAVAAARSVPFKFTLCARCEHLLWGRNDLDEVISRLQAFAEAGADLVYAPGLTTADQIEKVVQSVDKPVNVLLGMGGHDLTMADMERLGVARISLGSGIHRAAYTAAINALDEINEKGSFDFTRSNLAMGIIDEMMA